MRCSKLRVSVLTNKELGDCTGGGLTSKFDSVVLYWNEVDLFQLPDLTDVDLEPNALIVQAYIVSGRPAIKAFLPEAPSGCMMFGGNFAYSSDNRMPKLNGFATPIAIHDRVESWEQYRSFSD